MICFSFVMFQLRDSNLESCISILEKMEGFESNDHDLPLSYTVRTFLVNSMMYGVPQSRVRVYIVGIKNTGLAIHPEECLANIEKYMKLLQMQPSTPVARAAFLGEYFLIFFFLFCCCLFRII